MKPLIPLGAFALFLASGQMPPEPTEEGVTLSIVFHDWLENGEAMVICEMKRDPRKSNWKFGRIEPVSFIFFDAEMRKLNDKLDSWIIISDEFQNGRSDSLVCLQVISIPKGAHFLSFRLGETKFNSKPIKVP
jgi:hypothetical protein